MRRPVEAISASLASHEACAQKFWGRGADNPISQFALPLLQTQLPWPPMAALLVAGHAYQSLCRCMRTADAL